MSKNNQRNQSEINLGNETYDRGFTDGNAGVPKNIKKTHRHAHRYHIGYRHGETARNLAASWVAPMAVQARVATIPLSAAEAVRVLRKPAGFWTRVLRWLKS